MPNPKKGSPEARAKMAHARANRGPKPRSAKTDPRTARMDQAFARIADQELQLKARQGTHPDHPQAELEAPGDRERDARLAAVTEELFALVQNIEFWLARTGVGSGGDVQVRRKFLRARALVQYVNEGTPLPALGAVA